VNIRTHATGFSFSHVQLAGFVFSLNFGNEPHASKGGNGGNSPIVCSCLAPPSPQNTETFN
jgi:hypothetical protein